MHGMLIALGTCMLFMHAVPTMHGMLAALGTCMLFMHAVPTMRYTAELN